MMSPQRLAAWLRQVPKSTETYIVVLLPPDEDPTKEKTIAQFPGYAEADLPHVEFASQVLENIQSHCDGTDHACRYEVRALIHKDVMSSRIVRATPSPEEGGANDPLGIGNNPISANNATQQLVRTIEALLRQQWQSFGMINTAWKEVLMIQAEQIEALRKREAQLADNVLLEIARQADIEESDINKTHALNKLTDMLEKYAPLVVQSITGDEIE